MAKRIENLFYLAPIEEPKAWKSVLGFFNQKFSLDIDLEGISQNRGRLTMTASFILGPEAAHRIKGLIHADTQIGKDKVYLTVKQIYSLNEKGSLDFGGKEFNVGERIPLRSQKRHPEDKYGWWNLNQGTYLIEFNEQIELKEKEIAILEPREELLQNCCFHPVKIIIAQEKFSLIPLNVGYQGIDIKENARISTLRIVKT